MPHIPHHIIHHGVHSHGCRPPPTVAEMWLYGMLYAIAIGITVWGWWETRK